MPTTRRSRPRPALIALLAAVALLFSACTVDSSAQDLLVSDGDAASSNTSTQAPVSSDEPDEPQREEPYGPEPVYRSFRVDASTLRYSNGDPFGVSTVKTTIYADDLEYIAFSDAQGPLGVWLQRPGSDLTLCGNRVDGCVHGTRGSGLGPSTVIRTAMQTFPGPTPRIPAPFLTPGPDSDSYAGWDPVEDITFQGYQGRCFVSAGEYALFSGDPIEPSVHPEGDRMCVIFYERVSTLVISYDFGGDGTIEYEALDIRAEWDESDLVLHDGATSAPTDQDALDALAQRIFDEFDNGYFPVS